MASLQARHTRKCATGKPWTTFDGTAGCTCRPSYYVVVREGGKAHREGVGRNRKDAERALTKRQAEENSGAFVAQSRIRFSEWAEKWLDGLERKPSTITDYRGTIRFANEAFGDVAVSRLSVEHVKRFLGVCAEAKHGKTKPKPMSDSTRAKHLRVLGVCLESAVRAGHAGRNPVRLVPAGERPRRRRQEAAYFTNDELPVLFAQLRGRGGSYPVLFELALKTGMRLGELSALTWGDVDLVQAVIHVRRTYTGGVLGSPKNHEVREVDLTEEVVESLGEWWGALGKPGDDKLVLPGETTNGYLNPSIVLKRELYPAMERAGIPRVGPTGEKRTFHSLRHTFARIAIENGNDIFWLSKHLGHSSLLVTTGIYGHFEKSARRRQTQAMAGVFGV